MSKDGPGNRAAQAADWREVRLSDVLLAMRNGTIAEQIPHTTNFPVSRIETISSGQIDRARVGYLRKPEPAFLLCSGDILYSHINSISHIGKSAIYRGGDQLYHGMNLMLLRADAEVLLPEYLARLLEMPQSRAHARRECKPAINQASLGQRQIGALPILLPQVTEQRRITEILDAADEAIRSTEQLIAKLEQAKQGLLYDLLPAGMGSIRALGDLVDAQRPIVYGILMPGKGEHDGVPVVKVKDISNGEIRMDELLLTSRSIDEKYRRSRIQPGDLLFTIRGTVGRMAFVPPNLANANITQDTARISVTGADKRFVWYYLQMPVVKKFVDIHTLGQAVKGINLRDVRRIPIALPTQSEQEFIVASLDAATERIRNELDLVEALRLIKRGLADDLLAGRLRVGISA